MNKWKDTAITVKDNTLVIIEEDLSATHYLVSDTTPSKAERRYFKMKKSEVTIEDYSITRDINIQMLLADGWDAQDLLRLK